MSINYSNKSDVSTFLSDYKNPTDGAMETLKIGFFAIFTSVCIGGLIQPKIFLALLVLIPVLVCSMISGVKADSYNRASKRIAEARVKNSILKKYGISILEDVTIDTGRSFALKSQSLKAERGETELLVNISNPKDLTVFLVGVELERVS